MNELIEAIENVTNNKLVSRLNIFIGITALIVLLTSIRFKIPHLIIGTYVLAGLLAIQYILPTLLPFLGAFISVTITITWSIVYIAIEILGFISCCLVLLALKTLTYLIAFLIIIVGYPTLFLLDITGIKKQGN